MNAAHIARAIAAFRMVESVDTTSMSSEAYLAFRPIREAAAESRKELETGLESIAVPVQPMKETA